MIRFSYSGSIHAQSEFPNNLTLKMKILLSMFEETRDNCKSYLSEVRKSLVLFIAHSRRMRRTVPTASTCFTATRHGIAHCSEVVLLQRYSLMFNADNNFIAYLSLSSTE